MDPITAAIRATLVARDATPTGAQNILDAYRALEDVLEQKFGGADGLFGAIDALKSAPDSTQRQETLDHEIMLAHAGYDPDVLAAIQALLREIGAGPDEERVLGYLGLAHAALQQAEQAIEYYNLALDVSRESGNLDIEGVTLVNLGLIYANTGYVEQAIESYQRAIIIFDELESPTADTVRRFLAHLID